MAYKHLKFPNDSVFLVTGGSGFIGSNLCEAILNLGYQVRCLDDLSTGSLRNTKSFSSQEGYRFIRGSITDLETCLNACEGVDYVLHEAAWGSVPRSIEMPLYYEEVNIRGTLNMLEAARRTGVKKFVYASSSSVYGDHPSLPKVEGREGALLSPYALTKRANEEYGRLYYQLYGLDTYGLRYFNVFGRRQNPNGAYAAVIPKFIKALLCDEQAAIHGDGSQSRDFTYIENVVEANLKACKARHEIGGQVFNVAYGGRETILGVYNQICTLLGKESRPVFSPWRAGDIRHSNADITKAKELLDYAPEYDFQKGLAESIAWYCANADSWTCNTGESP